MWLPRRFKEVGRPELQVPEKLLRENNALLSHLKMKVFLHFHVYTPYPAPSVMTLRLMSSGHTPGFKWEFSLKPRDDGLKL